MDDQRQDSESPGENPLKTIEIDDLKPQVGILKSAVASHNQKQFKTSQPTTSGASATDALKKANAALQAKAKKYKNQRDALARLVH